MVGKAGKVIVAAAVCSAALPGAGAGLAQTNSEVQSELQALRAEIAQLKATQGETWLNERRAEEIKGLVREVLADADTRATLLQEGIMAGHDGKFFLQSADGAFRMNIGGQMQFRYVTNFQSDRTQGFDTDNNGVDDTFKDDEFANGFEFRRTKLAFDGHIGNPRIGYEIVLAADRNGGGIAIEDAVLSYEISDQLEIAAGRFKLPFARQELQSSKRQLAVDRSSVLEYFTLNRAEQIQLQYSADRFKVAGAFSEGANSGYEDFAEETGEYGLTGRVDVLLAGDWKQARDLVAWEDDFAAFIGGALHWEQADDSFRVDADDYYVATIDALVKSGPVSGQAAVFFADNDDADAWGTFIEAGYSVTEKWQPFARWEFLDVDGAEDEVQIATAGVNYYLRGHNAKFTLDAAWKYAGDNPATIGTLNGGAFSDGIGWTSGITDDEDQIALRAQFQLLF